MKNGFFARSLGNILKGALGGLAIGVIIWVMHVLRVSAGASPSSSALILVVLYSILLGSAVGLGVTRPQPKNWKYSLLVLISAFLMCLFFVPLILMGFLTFDISLQKLLLLTGGVLLLITLLFIYVQFIQKVS